MNKEVCYRTDTKLICTIQDEGWDYSDREKGIIGDSQTKVATLDISQDDLDDQDANGILINETIVAGCWQVDDADSPTSISKVA